MLVRFWLWLLTKLGQDPRGLFVYHDGRRWRRADPLETARRLFAFPEFDWDETPTMILSGRSDIQLDAMRIIAAAVRSAFEIPAASKGGLSEMECFDLLDRFRTYLGDVKKNGSLFPISPDSTASARLADSTTKPAADSGSTPIAPSPAPRGLPAERTSAGSASLPVGP